VKALRSQDINVKGMVAIFSYGFELATQNFVDNDVELTTISDYDSLIKQAVAREYVPEEDLNTLESWRKNPSEWNAK
ncbi:MAG TPA: orotate phosphoribosyltransferase, partial [Flavobacteriaceae bacterium]|nr:orotate phosphoribosyltransferase [Flavobacteriaceae bacterium]HBS12946.1 orotate phosphoribosyltransferase [Flavobacteriaceae bacterium]